MHIAFLLNSAAGGGAERAMIAVANAFAGRGARVDLVLVRAEGPFLDSASRAVHVVDLGARRLRHALRALDRYMRAEKPALLISALAGTDLPALIGKRLFGWPAHLHISVQNAPRAGKGRAGNWVERNWPRLMRLFYRRADSISAISTGVARDVEALLGRAPGTVPVIHNPLDLDAIAAAIAQGTGIAWLADRTVPTLVAVGRLVAQKDYPTMLRALARLRETRDVRLVVLGTGSEEAAIRSEIARLGLRDHVLLAGFSSNPFAAMAAADAFVLSSRWEGFANVVAEALACGAKVISTDCPSGPGEILGGGAWGRLVPVGDAEAMARAIAAALDAPVDREALRRRAEDFAVAGIADQYRAMFGELGLAA